MKSYNIAIIKGDGIGTEIVNETIKILNRLESTHNIKFNYTDYLMGGVAVDTVGVPLPDETIRGCLDADATLFGAIGGYKWDTLPRELRPETGLLKLRSSLEVYANLRPATVYDELINASSIKPEILKGVDIMVVRELTGGIYFGEPRGIVGDKGFNTMVYTVPEIERIARRAFETARLRGKKVCSVDKANVLDVSQLWRDTVIRIHKEYSDIELTHMYVDNAAMQLILNPRQFDVILTSNIFGDILSDEAGMLSGGIGLLPSASIGDKVAIYEPIHGSAPDIAGKGIANPIATIASASMMLRYSLKEIDAANAIDEAIKKTLSLGYRTKDIAAWDAKIEATTSQMGDAIAQNIK